MGHVGEVRLDRDAGCDGKAVVQFIGNLCPACLATTGEGQKAADALCYPGIQGDSADQDAERVIGSLLKQSFVVEATEKHPLDGLLTAGLPVCTAEQSQAAIGRRVRPVNHLLPLDVQEAPSDIRQWL